MDTQEHTNALGIENSSARLLPKHTVCLSRTASVGFVVVMGRPMATSQDFVNWVCGEELDWRFLKYVLVAERDSYSRFAHGTTHQTIYFPEVKAFHVCLPSLSEQRRVAGVLDALDNKIEHNRVLIGRLADAARSVFANVDGTRVRLGDVAVLDRGLSYKGSGLADCGLPMFNLANFTTAGWLDRSGLKHYDGDFRERHIVTSGDLLLANTDLTQRRAILGQPILVPHGTEKALYTHHVFALRFHDPGTRLRLLAFFALQSNEFRARAETFATGTTVAALPNDAVLDFEIRVPDAERLEILAGTADALVRRAWNAEEESTSLAAIRDALLPRLVSGRIRVPESYYPDDVLGTVIERAAAG